MQHTHPELPGFISNPYPLMFRAGVIVLASTYEGQPTVLIEAMACGCAVISTGYPGAVEILDHGTWGRLARVGDLASSLARARRASRRPHMPGTRPRAAARVPSRPAAPIRRQD